MKKFFVVLLLLSGLLNTVLYVAVTIPDANLVRSLPFVSPLDSEVFPADEEILLAQSEGGFGQGPGGIGGVGGAKPAGSAGAPRGNAGGSTGGSGSSDPTGGFHPDINPEMGGSLHRESQLDAVDRSIAFNNDRSFLGRVFGPREKVVTIDQTTGLFNTANRFGIGPLSLVGGIAGLVTGFFGLGIIGAILDVAFDTSDVLSIDIPDNVAGPARASRTVGSGGLSGSNANRFRVESYTTLARAALDRSRGNLAFEASTGSVKPGGSVTLAWSSRNVERCGAYGSWSGSKNTEGSEVVSNLQDDAYFRLSCADKNNLVHTKTVFVDVASDGDELDGLSRCPTPYVYRPVCGEDRRTYGNSCHVPQDLPILHDGVCTKEEKDAFYSGNKKTTPKPTITLTATPAVVPPGGDTLISWTTENATVCYAKGDWPRRQAFTFSFRIYKPTAGSERIENITKNSTYTLVCRSDAREVGQGSVSVTVGATGTPGSGTGGTSPSNPALDAIVSDFIEKLSTSSGVRPIEGWEQELLLQEFPGLRESDFVGVEVVNIPTRSDDGALTRAGYTTLLTNLSSRLNIPFSAVGAVDQIISAIE